MQHNNDLTLLQNMVYKYREHINQFSKGIDFFLSPEYQKQLRKAKKAEDKLTEDLSRTRDPNERETLKAQIEAKHKEFNDLSLGPVNFMEKQLQEIQKIENDINNKTRNIADRQAVGVIMIQLNGPNGSLAKRNYVMRLLEEGINSRTPKSREGVILLQLRKLSQELMSNLPQPPSMTASAPKKLETPRSSNLHQAIKPASSPEKLETQAPPEKLKSKEKSSLFAFFRGTKNQKEAAQKTLTKSAEIERSPRSKK